MPSRELPDRAFTWFVDRSLGRRRVPDTLRAMGMNVVVHDDIFEQRCADEV